MAIWIALAVAVGLIYGGLTWLKPSPKETREMHARQAARELGLIAKVRALSEWAKPRHTQAMVAFYALPGGVEEHFSIWKSGQEWVGQEASSDNHRASADLHAWLADAPEHVLGVDANASLIGAWWGLERADNVQQLKDWLLACPKRRGIPE